MTVEAPVEYRYRLFDGPVRWEGYGDGEPGPRSVYVGPLDVIDVLATTFRDQVSWVTVGVWNRPPIEGVLSYRRGSVQEPEYPGWPDEDEYHVETSIRVGGYDLGEEIAAYDRSWLRLWVRGGSLDLRTDPRHPRYDPLIPVVLAHPTRHVPGVKPGQTTTIARSLAVNLYRGGILVRPCPPGCLIPHDHSTPTTPGGTTP